MADIIQELPVKAPPSRVFELMASPEGLTQWWTKTSCGEQREGAEYCLVFGPEYDWRGRVTRYVPDDEFELQITAADKDWVGTRVGCELEPSPSGGTLVRFYHIGWPEANEHWRVSCHCWAMYLRVMRRYLEHGETVPFECRLDA